jgi:hypothetical protein
MEDYPQPVTRLIKDKSTERKGIGIPNTRYKMMTKSKGETIIADERQMKDDSLGIH